MASSRAPRPLTSNFAPQDLVDDFSQLAMQKCPGFEWDGSGYQASARSALGDAEALARHIVPLTILLKYGSTGFPSHPNLRQALTILQSKHQIFKDCANVFKVAHSAADNWRVMCRHLYNRKKEGCLEPCLKSLTDLIVLPSQTTAAQHTDTTAAEQSHVETVSSLVPTNNTLASSPHGILDPELVNSLFPTFDDPQDVPVEDECIMLGYREAEVRVISQKCMCPDCRPKKARPSETATAETFRHYNQK